MLQLKILAEVPVVERYDDNELEREQAEPQTSDFQRLIDRLTTELRSLPPGIESRLSSCSLTPLKKAANVLRFNRRTYERHERERLGLPVEDVELEQVEKPEAGPTLSLMLSKRKYRSYREILLSAAPYCVYCGRSLDSETATLDHVIPKSRDGENEPTNLVLACEGCNFAKGSDTPAGWAFRILTATTLPGQLDELLDRLRQRDESDLEEVPLLAFRG